MIAEPHGALAVLSIVASYFEMVGKARDGYTGQDRSGDFFKEGLGSVVNML